MATCALDLPVNIPWKLIAASADMMDTHFCNKLFPFAWRSSLALSVYEPALEDLPDGMCGQRLTYLKLTSSITGYQPTREETGQIVDYFGDQPTEDQRAVLDQILAEYFACYGVQVNLAVFPGPRKIWKEVLIDFGDLPDVRPDTDRPSPWTIRDVTFEAPGQAAHHLVDRVPPGGDSHAELDLQKEIIVTLPAGQSVGRVEARVAHASTSGIRMEAFAAGASVGVKNTGPAQDTIYTLAIEADGIERVVFTAPGNRAELLSFKYGIAAGVSSDPGGTALDDFPHIVDFEPKLRDLYQAATETGEVLSDSKSGIKTDKSFTHAETTQNSLSLGVKFPIGQTGAEGNVSGTHAHSDTDQTQWAVAADASRERRETQATSTQISQMYTLARTAPCSCCSRGRTSCNPPIFAPSCRGCAPSKACRSFSLSCRGPRTWKGYASKRHSRPAISPKTPPLSSPSPSTTRVRRISRSTRPRRAASSPRNAKISRCPIPSPVGGLSTAGPNAGQTRGIPVSR
jgi:hypothetical protein